MKRQSRSKVEVLRNSDFSNSEELDSEEPISQSELFKQVMLEFLGPILEIPVEESCRFARPAFDGYGELDWGAFGTVDFENMFPVNRYLYKADRLSEELRNVMIMFETVKEEVPESARVEVIKYVYSGKDIERIDDWHKWRMACWFSRARRLRDQIRELRLRGFRQSKD